MKKVLSLSLAASMALGAFASVAGAAATTPQDQFNELKAKGILSGYADGQAHLEDTLTRAQLAVILANLKGLSQDATGATKFSDVKAGAWYTGWIGAVAKAGLMNGTSATTFNPNAKVSYEQLATVMAQSLGLTPVSGASVPGASAWAQGWVKAAVDAGVAASQTNYKANALRYDLVSSTYATYTKLEAAKVFSVQSVTAVNAKKIQVVFNREVNETVAENAATYSFVGLTPGTVTPVLQDDKKTVVLTLTNAIANDTTFVVAINEVPSVASADVKTAKYTTTLTFSDTVKPTFTGVTYPEAGTAVLNFSEDLSTSGTVAVYDGSTLVTGLTVSNANNQITIAGLTTDKEYKVVVVGAKDQSSNLITAPVETTVKSTVSETVKPAIASLTSVDLTTLKVVFSEKLKQISAGVYANVTVDGVALTGETQSFDTTNNTLTISKTALAAPGIHSISISGYKDLSNNSGDTLTKAVAFAASAPVLEKTEVVSDTTDTYVQLTFNEQPSASAAQGVDITGTYTTPDNILKSVVSGSITEATAVTQVGNTLKIKVTGFEAGTYALTIPAAGISDGTTARTENLTINFALAASSDTSKPTVTNVYIPGENATAVVSGLTSVPLNTFYVKYSKTMGTSAVNPDNYSVDGQKVFGSAVFVGDKTLVKLTLKDSAITLNGDRSFQISSAVIGENNVAISSFSSTETLKENVKPLLSSAVVVDATHITLTFTEALADANFTSADAGNDFEVYIDGVKSPIASVGTGATSNDSQLSVVLSTPITASQLSSSTIIVKVLDTTDGTDANSNPLTTGTQVTVAK